MGSLAYPQTGAGPSYQPSPPPHHVYGSPNPVPHPNYPYPYSVPPTLSHHPPQFQQSPSRGNHRHNASAGAPPYNSRGAQHYHHYHPTQQPQFMHPHVNPQLGLQPQQQQQHIPYSPQSVKYNQNQPYSPSYRYPSPTAPVFTPSWQTQQPISPLPKQLSMSSPQTFHDPSLAPPPGLTQSPQIPVESIVPSPKSEIKTEPPAPSTPVPSSPLEPASAPSPVESPALSYTSTYSQIGTISTSDTLTSLSPPSSPESSSHVLSPRRPIVNPVAQWAIWSRRPQDPSHAPGIIISPRARPPPDVVQQAIDLKTPPQSRPSSPIQSPITLPTVVEELPTVSQEETTIGTTKEEEEAPLPVPEESLVVTQEETVVEASQEEEGVPTSVLEELPVVAQEEIISETAKEEAEAPPPVPLPPPVVKKSWAELLRPSPSSTSSSTSATRNTLPTSSIVGFSIPAATSASPSNPVVPVSPSKKSDLITLLTSGPSPNSTTSVTVIRPRGIVNSGNMCYANSVLQVLVYCPPFQRLFAELGKVLSGTTVVGSSPLLNGSGPSSSSASASGSTSPPINELNGKEKDASGMTPLVDATVEFLREFRDDKKPKSKTRKQVRSRKGSVLVNGTGSASGARSKGKEKETMGVDGSADDDSEVDWDACDSLLPTYLYDAMKLKKRFDHMKVCGLFLFLHPFAILNLFSLSCY